MDKPKRPHPLSFWQLSLGCVRIWRFRRSKDVLHVTPYVGRSVPWNVGKQWNFALFSSFARQILI